MKKKHNTYKSLGIGILLLAFSSCKNDFSEEALIASQQQEKIETPSEDPNTDHEDAITAINLAGQMLDYTITLHVNDVPVDGITITATNQTDGETVSATSDTNGNAIFANMQMGAHTIAITSANHVDLSYLVDFGSPKRGVHYEVIDGQVLPIPTSEASKIELFELNGIQTATLKGKVEIETDLTNSTPEVPQGLTIRANLDVAVNASHTNAEEASGAPHSIYVDGSLTFTEGNIGHATVDGTTGNYTMQVPATEQGTKVDLLFPVVEAKQRLAHNRLNGEDVPPGIRLFPALFGPDIEAMPTPEVSGVYAEFDAPPPPGRGFTFDPIPLRNTILPGDLDDIIDLPVDEEHNARYVGTSGSGYKTSPIVTVSDPDTLEDVKLAEMHADMRWDFKSVNITDGGSGYGAGEDVLVIARFTQPDNTLADVPLKWIKADGSGSLPTGIIDDIDPGITHEVIGVEVAFAPVAPGNQPVATLDYSGKVEAFDVTHAGFGYTSIPQFTITGGDPMEPATLQMTHMAFEHRIVPNNATITQPYVILPQIQYTYEKTLRVTEIGPDQFVIGTIDDEGDYTSGWPLSDPIHDHIKVVHGQIEFIDPGPAYINHWKTKYGIHGILDSYTYRAPEFLIQEPVHVQTTADVVIEDGKVVGLDNIVPGTGYNSEYNVTIKTVEGLPGSGAVLDLTNFLTNDITTEVGWFEGYTLISGGSGYTTDINIDSEAFEGTSSITVRNGETKIINVNYGTGRSQADIQ
ncbi:carboxypeptidase-like regulatory domain-containing protein [Flagellimonas sp. 2504JD1-5]